MKQKTCPKCGKIFKCYGKDCWCSKVKVSKKTLRNIAKRYKGCLCKKCLISSEAL